MLDVKATLSDAQERMEMAAMYLADELTHIRAGRANTAILDGVKVEKAIMDSDVGITPENNGEVIRLGIPQPTEERRKELVKQCNKIGERTKVEVRNVRGEVKDKLKKAIKDGLSEDLEKDAENDLQKTHDKYIKRIDDLLAEKQKEIMTV